MLSFETIFEQATGHAPLPYQAELATSSHRYDLVDIPTGLGKTAACVLAWIWQRRFAAESVRRDTPRRLVFCLPTRVLVSQTRNSVAGWLSALNIAGDDGVALHTLLGGDVDDDWLGAPERDAILIGTQDLLLSRALNRGYAMSRYLWPMAFGLLNNDARWIFDETQLMGAGLPTTAQLDGLAERLGTFGRRETLWMSATLAEDALATPDAAEKDAGSDKGLGWRRLELGEADRRNQLVTRRTTARKHLQIWRQQSGGMTVVPDATVLAAAVLDAHVAGTLTLVVVNRVERAQQLYRALLAAGRDSATTALIHSRFRLADRLRHEQRAGISTPAPMGDRIVVATQAIEAGVDISARMLWTEIAPWPSLVQRLGRLNRYGDDSAAQPTPTAYVVDLPDDHTACLPYDLEALELARGAIETLPRIATEVRDASLNALRSIKVAEDQKICEVLRRRDLSALFDTTPDLAGDDVDVSRFVRDADDSDVRLCWREFRDSDGARVDKPTDAMVAPSREELVAVPVYAVRGWKPSRKAGQQVPSKLWTTVPGAGKRGGAWQEIRPKDAVPGHTYVVDAEFGGYDAALGWLGQAAAGDRVPVVDPGQAGRGGEGIALDDDPRTRLGRWVSLREHASDVAEDAAAIVRALMPTVDDPDIRQGVETAARWHDLGKAHPAFQYMLGDSPDSSIPWAKSAGQRSGRTYGVPAPAVDGEGKQEIHVERRPGFRHELASALAWLEHAGDAPGADLVAYLVAAHHGKVRASIRSLPGEHHPRQRRHARGVWDGDELPAVDLGDDVVVASTKLQLAAMELGDEGERRSWQAMVLELLERHGPFRLALLETLVRAADWRASRREREVKGEG